jgi:D-glycerate 3-kinase
VDFSQIDRHHRPLHGSLELLDCLAATGSDSRGGKVAMDGVELVRALGAEPDSALARAAAARIDPATPAVWRAVAVALASSSPPSVIGIAGGQGAGKSTLARAISAALPGRACVLSLDDFYLGRSVRARLAAEVHPLLATRGPPGTHDPALMLTTLEALLAPRDVRVLVPRFDKGTDDRLPVEAWVSVAAPVDHVVVEGWCLGVLAGDAASLDVAVNDLERLEDGDCRWRRYVDAAIAAYLPLWQRVGFWIYLEVPDRAAVVRWRGEQEQALPQARRMSVVELDRFVAHYERLTLRMRAQSPARAHWHLLLDPEHGVVRAVRNRSPVEFRERSA